MKRTPKFSTTMPSEAAKNASMWLMKCCSSSASRTLSETQGTAQAVPDTTKWQEAQRDPPVSLSQSRISCDRSTSSTVQKLATAFLYISQRP